MERKKKGAFGLRHAGTSLESLAIGVRRRDRGGGCDDVWREQRIVLEKETDWFRHRINEYIVRHEGRVLAFEV